MQELNCQPLEYYHFYRRSPTGADIYSKEVLPMTERLARLDLTYQNNKAP